MQGGDGASRPDRPCPGLVALFSEKLQPMTTVIYSFLVAKISHTHPPHAPLCSGISNLTASPKPILMALVRAENSERE